MMYCTQPPLFGARKEECWWIYYIWDIDAQDWLSHWGEQGLTPAP